ncbi:MAG TPA: MazG nucleotide pyrophosphohydrolase domain-containing protein [Sphingomonas sp.]|nr:MazG nucleotide pyrophosphohydrolase domain-containing protein [Sphingomonas sp.]
MSALDGITEGQPALARADAISHLAAAIGFDWGDAAGARAKVIEEMAEVDAADTLTERRDEIGDLLFAIVNWARKLGIDPEAALHQATSKFERRFRAMESEAGVGLPGLTLDQMEHLWQAVKRQSG